MAYDADCATWMPQWIFSLTSWSWTRPRSSSSRARQLAVRDNLALSGVQLLTSTCLGLSTFLHMDRIAQRFAGLPSVVRGAPVVGYFLDHYNFAHDSGNYSAWMQYMYVIERMKE